MANESHQHILFIGKYPPIQGGTSRNNYWLIQNLARNGFRVTVVSNSFSGPGANRARLEMDDLEWLHQAPGVPSGAIKLSLTHSNLANIYFIPYAEPHISTLVTAALDAIKRDDINLIYASYLEPYGVTALMVHLLTGIPYVFAHAGSDIYRLLRTPTMSAMHMNVIQRASKIFTAHHIEPYLRALGVPQSKLSQSAGLQMPWDLFAMSSNAQKAPSNGIRARRPSIGIYGKAGSSKGTYVLLEALALLQKRGVVCALKVLTNGEGMLNIRPRAKELGIEHLVEAKNFIPNWRIPSFIRDCSACCFLENAFWLPEHTPVVPIEILASGGALIISGESAKKLSPWMNLRDSINCIIVEDPTNPSNLADALAKVVLDETLESDLKRLGQAEIFRFPRASGTDALAQELSTIGTNVESATHSDVISRMKIVAGSVVPRTKIVCSINSGNTVGPADEIDFADPKSQFLRPDRSHDIFCLIGSSEVFDSPRFIESLSLISSRGAEMRLGVCFPMCEVLYSDQFLKSKFFRDSRIEFRFDSDADYADIDSGKLQNWLRKNEVRGVCLSFMKIQCFETNGGRIVNEIASIHGIRAVEIDLSEIELAVDNADAEAVKSALVVFLQSLESWNEKHSIQLSIRSTFTKWVLGRLGINAINNDACQALPVSCLHYVLARVPKSNGAQH